MARAVVKTVHSAKVRSVIRSVRELERAQRKSPTGRAFEYDIPKYIARCVRAVDRLEHKR